MDAWIKKHGIDDMQAMIRYAKALTDKYGESAGAYACELCDEIARMEEVDVKSAEMAELATYRDVAVDLHQSIQKSPAGKLVPGAVERLTKRVAEDTVLKNARRNGAKWAWIPSGDTCAFCLTLASRGWQYASKNILSGGHAEHIHANCDCEFCISYLGGVDVEGYDSKRYLKIYEDAEGKSAKDKMNSIRRGLYAEKKNKIVEDV